MMTKTEKFWVGVLWALVLVGIIPAVMLIPLGWISLVAFATPIGTSYFAWKGTGIALDMARAREKEAIRQSVSWGWSNTIDLPPMSRGNNPLHLVANTEE